MELTPVQQDALIELLNIGFGRAGAALSELTGHRVTLEVPEVSIHPISSLAPALKAVASEEVASVHQIFSGSVAGDANYKDYLDFDGLGAINGLDLGQFRTRFGIILP